MFEAFPEPLARWVARFGAIRAGRARTLEALRSGCAVQVGAVVHEVEEADLAEFGYLRAKCDRVRRNHDHRPEPAMTAESPAEQDN